MIIKHIAIDYRQATENIPVTNMEVVILGHSFGFLIQGIGITSKTDVSISTPIWQDTAVIGTVKKPIEVSPTDKAEIKLGYGATPLPCDVWVYLEEEGTRNIYSFKLPKGQSSSSKLFSEMIVTVAPETAYSTPLSIDTFKTLTAYLTEGLFVATATPETSAEEALGLKMAKAEVSEETIVASGGIIPAKKGTPYIILGIVIIAIIVIIAFGGK